ncbi:MAG: neutral zinc metallopeptidase, partial [Hyphomicrobium sp.]
SRRFKTDIMAALKTIGGENFGGRSTGDRKTPLAVHGTSAQRARWFMRGMDRGNMRTCDTFRTPEF